MAEPMRSDKGAISVPGLSVRFANRRTVMRLKAWQPVNCRDVRTIDLDGLSLPMNVGYTTAGSVRVMATAPSEWLLVSQGQSPGEIRSRLGEDLAARGFVLVDLSAGLTACEVSGTLARALLTKTCGVDLHPDAFETGQCARTRLAQIPVVVLRDEAPDTFELLVLASHAHYFREWLEDAVSEFGLVAL
jgi:sarcosine oxidase, subunit gamma